MKAAAIIAEYNPLHSGHIWQLGAVRERSGADFVAVLMSGDFVQRGESAVYDKYVRAEAALAAGADLVLELPVSAATGSAQRFAEGAAAILSTLGCFSELWFGSEAGDISPFLELTDVLVREPEEYRSLLRESLSEGLSFPAARENALCGYLGSEKYSGFLQTPNNILGLEYCLALRRMNTQITPRTHERIRVPAASEIRAGLLESGDPSAVFPDDFSSELRYQLFREDEQSLAGYLDVTPDLARRIIKNMHLFRSFSQFAGVLHTKNMTLSACRRALLHILLGITEADLAAALRPRYARMLAKGDCGPLLSEIKKSGRIPLLSNLIDAPEELRARDLFASSLYESAAAAKAGRPSVHEFSRKLITNS